MSITNFIKRLFGKSKATQTVSYPDLESFMPDTILDSNAMLYLVKFSAKDNVCTVIMQSYTQGENV